MSAKQKLPLACRRGNGACLGLRGGNAADASKAKKWNTRGGLPSWSPDIVTAWQAQKFSKVEKVHPPTRLSGLWTFVAVAPEDEDCC